MPKIISYIAISLNGKIARKSGEVDWLDAIPNPDNNDYGYYAFYDTIDTTIMGYKTFELLKSWDVPFPYPDKKNYVLTHKEGMEDENVTFIHFNQVNDIVNQAEKNVWLIGGGETNTAFLNKGLLDELIIHIMPIIIPDGIDLFQNVPAETKLALIESKNYESGVVELHYQVL